MFSTTSINYTYNKITMPFSNAIQTIKIDEKSKGLIAEIKFGLTDVEQIKCGIVPISFNEKDYGGTVEYFTMDILQFVVK